MYINFFKKNILYLLIIGTFFSYFLYKKNNSIITLQNNNTSQKSKDILISPSKFISTYKNGIYTGDSIDAYYGNMQVAIIIKDNKLVDIQILDYPKDRNTSIRINNIALPILKSETIKSQNAKINAISGASYSSRAYKVSLASALSQAIN